MTHPWPLPLLPQGPLRGLPLAGSDLVRFAEVVMPNGGLVAADALEAELRDRLTAPRARLAGLTLDRPRIMGILNVTPDSFSDGGDFAGRSAAVAQACAMVAAGADIIDIGGESTRPGAVTVSVEDETARVVPVVAELRAAGLTTPISVDTRKSAVARSALAEGADIVNDVSALAYDSEMAHLVASTGVPVCLMHAQGTPETMQQEPRYGDVVTEVYDALAERIGVAEAAGIPRERIIVDPGIGFGKNLQHNLTLLRSLAVYHGLGCAILLGVSRKRFIGTISGAEVAKDRVPGSIAVALAAVQQGIQILRVHDVAETRQALSLHRAVMGRAE